MNRIEREYKNALDQVRFSQEEKERMMNSLMNQQEQALVKRRSFRPLRTGLWAAAVSAALIVTAGAAGVAARQNKIQYLEKEEFQERYWEEVENGHTGPYTYSNSRPNGTDMNGMTAEESELWWKGPAGELLEDTAGTEQDGWTAKRVFRYRGGHGYDGVWDDEREYVETRYLAPGLSGFNGLWAGLDTGWLEEHYTADPNGQHFHTISTGGELFSFGFASYYGRGDTMFNLCYYWDRFQTHKDEYRVSSNYAFTEIYTTADGMEAAIEMNPTVSGKTEFWVTLYTGHHSFSMFGTQMELDDLHRLLDSLDLSRLVGYDPLK